MKLCCTHYLSQIDTPNFDVGQYEISLARQPDVIRIAGKDADLAWAYVSPSEWDSRVLGKSAWSLQAIFWRSGVKTGKTVELIRDLEERISVAAHDAGVSFLFTRMPANNLDVVQVFCADDWQPVDTLVVFQHATSQKLGTPSSSARPLSMADIPTVSEIARTAFTDGRISTDINFDEQVKRRFYEQMAISFSQNALAGDCPARVIEHKGRVRGFFLTSGDEVMSSVLGSRYGYLSLIAVHPNAHGQGLGRQLALDALAAGEQTFDLMEVSTQLSNRAAIALYEDIGLRADGGIYSLHKHL